jgi:pimeloyl-ACP methyl ester carboxylesterase
MQNPRFHGNPPYTVAVAHGGPGARGSLWPLARELGKTAGVLEPMQTAPTAEGQAEELRGLILKHCQTPAVLVGHSWGAWLVFIAAARFPEIARKLVLVGSGPFEERWTEKLMDARLSRLRGPDAAEARRLLLMLEGGATEEGGAVVARLGELLEKADTYSPAPPVEPFEAAFDADIHASVWSEAAKLRASGELLSMAERITCPVAAIHGDWDPHPWRGVREPLSARLKDFKLILLKRCGHEPWNELYARETFFDILRQEVNI